mmetsp:Transcript_28433/g.47791  ORF Transcript_28433/g.47791 Transcript_28433/m.47791 type:complete len:337 (-) Transcript_28433:684-1694(-)
MNAKILEAMLEGYLRPEEKSTPEEKLETQVVDSSVQEETSVPLEQQLGDANGVTTNFEAATKPIVDEKCHNPTCRKKASRISGSQCCNKMCFNCCYDLKAPCKIHFPFRRKREEEDKFILEGMRQEAGVKKKTSFYHYEEKFMKCNETIVIWCLHDFLRRKKWSDEIMEQNRREKRTQALIQRRQSETTSAPGSTGRKRPRDAAVEDEGTTGIATTTTAVKEEEEEDYSAGGGTGTSTSRHTTPNTTTTNNDTSNNNNSKKKRARTNGALSATASPLAGGSTSTGAANAWSTGANTNANTNTNATMIRSLRSNLSRAAARRYQALQAEWSQKFNLI